MEMTGHSAPDATMTAIPRVIAARADGMTTIGVALKVPEPWATQIRAARESLGDPQANSIPTHVTLIAPADIPMHSLPAVDAHLTSVSQECSAFRIQLRGTATFRPVSPVVFIAVVDGISGCERIEKAVRRGPLLRRRRFPYHPHVTLVHNMPEDVLDKAFAEYEDFAATFAVDQLSLYQQDAEGTWHPIKDYRLQA